jgi:fatty-acyl-CoA synthase
MEVIMNYPLTTTTILEYGNNVYHHKKIVTYLPDGSRQEYLLAICINDAKLLMH